MFYRFSLSLDKFNLPMLEQSRYDVIRSLITWSLGSKGIHSRGQTNFESPPTKTAEFEVQNRRAQKRGRGKSITFAFCYFYLFFEVIKQFKTLKFTSKILYQ